MILTAILIGFGSVTNLMVEKVGKDYMVQFDCGTPTAQAARIEVHEGNKMVAKMETENMGIAFCGAHNYHQVWVLR